MTNKIQLKKVSTLVVALMCNATAFSMDNEELSMGKLQAKLMNALIIHKDTELIGDALKNMYHADKEKAHKHINDFIKKKETENVSVAFEVMYHLNKNEATELAESKAMTGFIDELIKQNKGDDLASLAFIYTALSIDKTYKKICDAIANSLADTYPAHAKKKKRPRKRSRPPTQKAITITTKKQQTTSSHPFEPYIPASAVPPDQAKSNKKRSRDHEAQIGDHDT